MKTIESRPCTCNNVTTGLYYNMADCLDCWSYYFDPYWSERWGKPKEKKPPKPLLEDTDPEFVKEFIKRVRRQAGLIDDFSNENANPKKMLPCINLGTIVSRANCNCPLKFVHKCDKHGTCIRGPQLHPDTRSCLDCADYEPDDPNL